MKLSKYGVSIDTDELFKSQELKDAERMYGQVKNKVATLKGKVDAVRGLIDSKADPITKIQQAIKTIDFRVKPNSPAGVVFGPRSNNAAVRRVGSIHAFNGNVPDELSVEITSKSEAGSAHAHDLAVVAILQESINLSTRSHWETYNPLGEGVGNAANAVMQALGKSFVTRLSSRRIWKGTEPIRIRLVLKFEAYKDAYADVVAPNLDLQKMALPTGGDKFNEFALLTPPGPYPFSVSGVESTTGIGDNISIHVGRLFTFDRVVISEISTTYSNKFDPKGHPVSAETSIDFATYEIYTKGKLDTAYVGGGERTSSGAVQV